MVLAWRRQYLTSAPTQRSHRCHTATETRLEHFYMMSRTLKRDAQLLVVTGGKAVVGVCLKQQVQASIPRIPEARGPENPGSARVSGHEGLSGCVVVTPSRSLTAMSRQRSAVIVTSCMHQREEQQ